MARTNVKNRSSCVRGIMASGISMPHHRRPISHVTLSDAELSTFRTLLCEGHQAGTCNDSDGCPRSHCLTWQRRNPFEIPYSPKLCSEIEFVKKGAKMTLLRRCNRGRACSFAHSKEEELYHPLMYKTKMCSAHPSCNRCYCPFAHNTEELRRPFSNPLVRSLWGGVGLSGDQNENAGTASVKQITPPSAHWRANGSQGFEQQSCRRPTGERHSCSIVAASNQLPPPNKQGHLPPPPPLTTVPPPPANIPVQVSASTPILAPPYPSLVPLPSSIPGDWLSIQNTSSDLSKDGSVEFADPQLRLKLPLEASRDGEVANSKILPQVSAGLESQADSQNAEDETVVRTLRSRLEAAHSTLDAGQLDLLVDLSFALAKCFVNKNSAGSPSSISAEPESVKCTAPTVAATPTACHALACTPIPSPSNNNVSFSNALGVHAAFTASQNRSRREPASLSRVTSSSTTFQDYCDENDDREEYGLRTSSCEHLRRLPSVMSGDWTTCSNSCTHRSDSVCSRSDPVVGNGCSKSSPYNTLAMRANRLAITSPSASTVASSGQRSGTGSQQISRASSPFAGSCPEIFVGPPERWSRTTGFTSPFHDSLEVSWNRSLTASYCSSSICNSNASACTSDQSDLTRSASDILPPTIFGGVSLNVADSYRSSCSEFKTDATAIAPAKRFMLPRAVSLGSPTLQPLASKERQPTTNESPSALMQELASIFPENQYASCGDSYPSPNFRGQNGEVATKDVYFSTHMSRRDFGSSSVVEASVMPALSTTGCNDGDDYECLWDEIRLERAWETDE